MHPVLFKFGGLTIHTYGFFIALAVLAGMFISRYEAKRLGMDPDKVADAFFYVVIAAIVGSRLFYVLTNIDFFISAPLEIFKIWNGGLVFYGGFIAAAAVVIIYLKMHHLPLGKMADIAALALPLGHSLGRIGCFLPGAVMVRSAISLGESYSGIRIRWPRYMFSYIRRSCILQHPIFPYFS